MKRFNGTLFALLLCVSALPSQTTHSMIVSVSGLRSNTGTVPIYLFASAEDFPTQREKAFRAARPAATTSGVTVLFADVPPGIYAVAAYHDENANGKMDRHWYGPPKEGSAASNNAKGMFGPPSFTDAQFSFRISTDTVKIFITY